jgi:5-methylthioadenosine/S-adenosylhomocysteine deaminase
MNHTLRLAFLWAILCAPHLSAAPAAEGYLLKGTVVTPDQVISDGGVRIVGAKITAVGSNLTAPSGTRIIDTKSIILPGFIDLHNHLAWNLFPRWKPTQSFNNRYDWQQLPIYGIALSTPHTELMDDGKKNLGCLMNLYAEVKAITEGETSVVGSLAKPCVAGLARNLDYYSDLYQPGVFGKEKLKYEVFPLQVPLNDSKVIIEELENNALSAYIIHVAEGRPTDASAAREFTQISKQGLLRKGVSLIHADALTTDAFRQMARNGVGLIWSPRSNIELYADTTDVASAQRQHVTLALAPDWSPTGSSGMLQELVYASTWNGAPLNGVFSPSALAQMTTKNPAALAGLDDKIGTLAAGFYADILVLKKVEDDPYESIAHSTPADVQLVVIGGAAVYGEPKIMKTLLPKTSLDAISICGSPKLLDLESSSAAAGTYWGAIADRLNAALNEWGTYLAPLAECPGIQN